MKTHTTHRTSVLYRATRFIGALLTAVFILDAAALSQPLAPVILGKAANYAVLAKSGVSTTGVTAVTGDIGLSPAAATFITGFSLIADPSNVFSTSSYVTGKVYASDYAPPTPTIMTSTIADMEIAYTDAAGRTLPDFTELGAGDVTSMTLTPGLYKWGTGLLISTAGVTISGSATDVWIFQIAGNLTVSNGAIITLSGGAVASNIFWQVAGQITLGTTSAMKGNLLCQTLIEMQTGATLNGRALAQTAVTLDASTVVRPAIPAVYNNPSTINLGTAANFRILAGTAVTIGAGCTVTGDVGISPGSAFTQSGTLIGSTHLNDAAAGTAQGNLTTAFNNAAAATPDATIASELGGTTLGRGVYAAAASTFGVTGTLVLNGSATDVFIFQMATTLITAASSNVTLAGGAVWQNVFWQVGSSATLGTNSTFRGNILAFTAITQNSGASLSGTALARNSFVTVSGTEVLPVEIVSFTATANRANADLHWSTATEINNHGFEIERRQTAAWNKVGFVSGAGTSNAPRDYSYTDNNLAPGRYTYRLKQVDNDGVFSYHGSIEVVIATSAPQEFALSQNYPNPFNPSTVISYQIPVSSKVTLKVYDMLGNEVATLINGEMEAGSYTVPFSAISGSTLASGMYIYRLQAGSFVATKKLVLMK